MIKIRPVKFKKCLSGGFLLLALFLPACAPLEPYLQNFNFLSVAEEKKIGDRLAQEIAQQMVLLDDSSAGTRIRDLGEKLVSALDRRDFQYRFHVVQDPEPNAFTIPGGSIYVHTGLIQFADDEDELAGVLAHEIGHAYERHPAKGMSRAMGVEYLTNLFLRGNQNATASRQIKTMALQLVKGTALTRYSREDERRADQTAFYLARSAGFHSNGLLRFLRKLDHLGRTAMPFSFLSTHPPTPERIARLEALESVP